MATGNVSLCAKRILSSEIKIDHSNWKNVKNQALINTTSQINKINAVFSEDSRKQISNIALGIQSKINENTLCVEDIENYATDLKDMGIEPIEINKFLQEIILMAKHKSGIGSIASSFGINYKTTAIKDFINNIRDNTKYTFVQKDMAGLTDIVANLITSAVGKVTQNKELIQQSFKSLKEQNNNNKYTGYTDEVCYILNNYIPHIDSDTEAANDVLNLIQNHIGKEKLNLVNKPYSNLDQFIKKEDKRCKDNLYSAACDVLKRIDDYNALINFMKFASSESIRYEPNSQDGEELKSVFFRLDYSHRQSLVDSVHKRLSELVLSRIDIDGMSLNDCMKELQQDIEKSTRSDKPIQLFAIPSDENSSIIGLAENADSPNLAPKNVAMFTFCGTLENYENSESIHVDLYNRAQLKPENKRIYNPKKLS